MELNSLTDKCRQLSIIGPQDRWWFYQCAGVPEDTIGKLSESNDLDILSHLEGVFDNRWYVKYGNIRNGGICANLLLGGVRNTAGNIMRLSYNIHRLGGIHKLGKAKKDLRTVTKCLDTILEIEVLSCFAEEGFEVTPYPILASGSVPDAKVKVDDSDVFVEVTHMEWPKPQDFPGTNWKSRQGQRLVEKCIAEVAQLPSSECGVIIMNPPTLIDEEVGKSILASFQAYLLPDLYTRVSGIILANKLIERSGFIKTSPMAIVNIHASKRCDGALERLVQALWKHPRPTGYL